MGEVGLSPSGGGSIISRIAWGVLAVPMGNTREGAWAVLGPWYTTEPTGGPRESNGSRWNRMSPTAVTADWKVRALSGSTYRFLLECTRPVTANGWPQLISISPEEYIAN